MPTLVPRQFFIVPDPKVKEATFPKVGNLPYQGGSYVSTATSNTSNTGDLQVFGTGTPSSDFDVDLRIQKGGSVNNATFVYRTKDASDENYYGEPDRRYFRDIHAPYSDLSYTGIGATAFLAPLKNREVVVVGNNKLPNTIRLAYRDITTTQAREDGGTWTELNINLQTTFKRGIDFAGGNSTDSCMLDACTRDDGTVFIAVKYRSDMDIYSTTDGITWSLVSASILSNFINEDPFPNTSDLPNTYGRLGRIYNLKIAASGDFIRIVYAGYSATMSDIFLKCLSSSNNGSSWTLVQDNITVEADNITGGDRFGLEICGLRNGQFLLSVLDQYYTIFRIYTAQGNGSFNYISSLDVWISTTVGVNQAPKMYLCRGNDWVYALVDNDNYVRWDGGERTGSPLIGYAGEINILWLNLNDSFTEGTSWNNMGTKKNTLINGEVVVNRNAITGFKGTQRFNFARGKLYNRGDSIAFFAGMYDNNYTQDISLINPIYLRISGWSKRPVTTSVDNLADMRTTSAIIDVTLNPVMGHIRTGRLFNWVEWRSVFGSPSGALYGSQWSYWEARRTGSSTTSWNSNRLRITCYSTIQKYAFRWIDPTIDADINGLARELIPRFSFGFYALNYTEDYKWMGQDPAGDYKIGSVNGSCMVFSLKVSAGGQAGFNYSSSTSTFPRGCGVQIKSYVKGTISPNAIDQTIFCNLIFQSNGFEIFDINGATRLTYNSTIDLTNMHEFRFAMRPKRAQNGSPLLTGSSLVECVLAYRQVGTDTWANTSVFTLNTTPSSADRTQSVEWGNFAMSAGNTPVVSEWRDFCVHAETDLGTFDLVTGSSFYPDLVRGRTTSSSKIYLDEGVSVVWGGANASVGDKFILETLFTNAFSNSLLYDSPRQRWSSGSSVTSNTGTIQAKGGAGKEGIVHNAIAVFGTNAKEVSLQYGSSYSVGVTISMLRSVGRIEEAVDNAIRIKFDNPSPTSAVFSSSVENRKFFAHFTNTPSAVEEDTSYKISRHYFDQSRRHWLECAGVTMSFSSASGIVGTTISVYSDRGWLTYGNINVDENVRWVLTGSTWNPYEKSNPSQELYAGRLVVGTTLSLHPVQLDWTYTDSESANVTINDSRSGITWGYREGASARVLSGAYQGDLSEQVRRYVRDSLRSANNFNEYGLVYINYENDRNGYLSDDYFLLVRFDDNITLQNIGWFYDEDEGKWRPVGNMNLTLTEIV